MSTEMKNEVGAPSIETAVVFANGRGENLVGVYHAPPLPPRATIVMLHGWSGTRCGPHQMLTRAARAFCDHNFAVLRFDFAGRGDSDGDTETATLASMQDDARAAFAWAKSRSAENQSGPLWVLGLCSGCEIVVASATDDMAGAILWSAPVFAALPSDERATRQRAARKRGANLQKYARKLLQFSTYAKILRGQIDTQSVSKAIAGGGGAASKNRESDEVGQLPPGFRRASLANWRAFSAPRLQIYGDADPIAAEALQWYQENSGAAPDIETVSGANHSFYGVAWEREVFAKTLLWLEKQA